MKNDEVRILSVELTNFKNVENGIIVMPSDLDKDYFSDKADLVGIYGKNGSGKTAFLEALKFIKDILSGNKLDGNEHYINKKVKELKVSVKFSILTSDFKAIVGYSVTYGSKSSKLPNEILSEILTISSFEDEKLRKKRTLINYKIQNKLENLFKPKFRLKEILKISPENKVNLEVARQFSLDNNTSFIFSKKFFDLFEKKYGFNETKIVLSALHKYSIKNLFVITNKNNDLICSELFLPVSLTESNTIDKERYVLIQKIIEKINIVLITIIPGLQIEIHEFKDTLDNENNVKKRIELISNREGVKIPLKYESDGIIRIISILDIIVCVFNYSGMFLAIDELDSGIFEFILGQFISVFQECAKGQIVFTSHNLRVLELAKKNSIVFSTIYSKKRFIRFSDIKSISKLRDGYLRSMVLDAQKETIYEENDDVEISRALRKIKMN